MIIKLFILLLLFIIAVIIIKGTNIKENYYIKENIQICYINLKRNKLRNEIMTNQLIDERFLIKRIEGIDGSKINKKDLIYKGYLSKNNNIKQGQLGCAMSHINSLLYAKKSVYYYSIILEDDVIIPKSFEKDLSNILNNQPDKWDIIFLGGCNIKGTLYKKKYLIPKDNSGSFNLCMHAYIVNKDSIDKILKCIYPIKLPIDNQLRLHYDKLNVFFHYPNIVNQNKDMRSIRRDIDGINQSLYWKYNHDNMTIVK